MLSEKENIFIENFVTAPKRSRAKQLLSHPDKRIKFTARLAHSPDLDFSKQVKHGGSINQNPLVASWSKQHPNHTVLILSENPDLDKREMLLHDALLHADSSGFGSVVICDAKHLVLYFAEDSSENAVLHKPG